ncbi:MAG: hypothetical protein Q8936_21150 [Bacillota bacterium]|nr:hypothetical protein [Bacillota bacterium]
MEKEQLEIKRAELNIYIENFNLSSEAVVKKAREFETLANKIYGIKDGAYWMSRAKELEDLLREVSVFCPAWYKDGIEKVLGIVN